MAVKGQEEKMTRNMVALYGYFACIYQTNTPRIQSKDYWKWEVSFVCSNQMFGQQKKALRGECVCLAILVILGADGVTSTFGMFYLHYLHWHKS